MIYTVNALVVLTWFLLWAYKHEGIPLVVVGSYSKGSPHRIISLTKYFHFGLTFITAFLAWFEVGGIYLACAGAGMILVAFFSRNRVHGLTYFVELILSYVTLISLFYVSPKKRLAFFKKKTSLQRWN